MFKKGVCFGSEVDSGSVSYRCLREGGLDYGSVAYSGEEGGIFWRDGYILGGRISEGGGGIYSGRVG